MSLKTNIFTPQDYLIYKYLFLPQYLGKIDINQAFILAPKNGAKWFISCSQNDCNPNHFSGQRDVSSYTKAKDYLYCIAKNNVGNAQLDKNYLACRDFVKRYNYGSLKDNTSILRFDCDSNAIISFAFGQYSRIYTEDEKQKIKHTFNLLSSKREFEKEIVKKEFESIYSVLAKTPERFSQIEENLNITMNGSEELDTFPNLDNMIADETITQLFRNYEYKD